MDVLIIGKGVRVQKTLILPLKKRFENVYLYSKNKQESQIFCKENNLYFVEDLSKLGSSIKIIFIAIPSILYLDILKKINLKNIKIIYLDTPIIGTLKNLALLKYQNINLKVTEDWISKPFFYEITSFLKKNQKEKINRIEFFNSGYSYHALAVSRTLYNTNKFHFMLCIKKRNNFHIRINNLQINIINPRNYLDCYTQIETTNYILIDNQYSNKIGYNKDKNMLFFNRKKNKHSKINYLYSFEKEVINTKEIGEEYENEDKIFSIEKKINNMEKEYLIFDGIYDSFIITFLDKFGIFFDFGIGKFTLQKILIKCLKYLV